MLLSNSRCTSHNAPSSRFRRRPGASCAVREEGGLTQLLDWVSQFFGVKTAATVAIAVTGSASSSLAYFPPLTATKQTMPSVVGSAAPRRRRRGGCWDAVGESWSQVEQFLIVVVGFWCMGAGCGFERSLLPRMAVVTFHETKASVRLNFVATFGLSKAVANALPEPLADRYGRKPALILGCLVGLPVMPFVIVADSWTGITLMNGAFGLSQGLIGSSLFFLFIDLLGPKRRGVAVGVGECSIYVSTAVVNIIAGKLASAYGYRPVPFIVATAISLVGLLSTIPLKDTLDQVLAEQSASELVNRKKYARMMSTHPSHLDEEERIPPTRSNRSFRNLDGFVSPWRGSVHTAYTHATPDGYRSPWRGSTVAGGSVAPEEESWIGTGDLRSLCSFVEGEEGENDETTPLKPDEQIVGVEGYHGISTTFVIAAPAPVSVQNDDDGTIMEELLDPISPPDSAFVTIKNLVVNNPSFSCLCLGGMMLNFKDGFAWGSFPVFFRHEHMMDDEQTNLLIALYPLCWGFSQAFTGALSDHFGRKLFLLAGTGSCAVAMALFSLPNYLWGAEGDDRHYRVWVVSDVLLGIGTALVYPALQAGAADEVDPKNRGIALGFYRFVRDMGYVVGAIVCGHLSDWIGYEMTFLVNAAVLSAALLSMILFYHPRGESEMDGSTKEHHIAKSVKFDQEEVTSRDVNMNASTTSRRVRRVIKILEHKCSDSW